MSRNSVSKSAWNCSLISSVHFGGVHTYDGDEAFVANRKAKLHKPFIYAGGKSGNLLEARH